MSDFPVADGTGNRGDPHLAVTGAGLRLMDSSFSSRSSGSEASGAGAVVDFPLQKVVDETGDYAIIVLDPAGRVVLWSKGATKIKGYSADEVIGKDFSILYSPEDIAAGKPHRELEVAVASGRHEDSGWRLRKDGSHFWAHIVITPLRADNGELQGFVKVIRNTTADEHMQRREDDSFAALDDAHIELWKQATGLSRAREAAEHASARSEEANRTKSTFLATMSHEIRTPMNAVIGMTGLLLDTPLDEEQQYFVRTIRESGDALLILINEILDFSKIESGALDLERVPFNVQDCAETAMTFVAHAAAGKGLELVALVSRRCPKVVVGDGTRLGQVLINLLSNAVKFTPNGEVVLSLDAEPVPDLSSGPDRVRLSVSVRDTGIGIPAERISLIFEPFSQADSTTTRVYGGTGLGLAISRRLITAMGGELDVVSRPGEGSTFFFTADFDRASNEQLPPLLETANDPLLGKSALVVDDSAASRDMLTGTLRELGMECTATSEPAQALRLVGSDSFDVAILDMRMPQMDGARLAAAIRRLPPGKQLPLILLVSMQEQLPPADRELFAALLTKPVRTLALRDALLLALTAGSESPARTPESDCGGAGVCAPTPSLRILLADDNPVNQQVLQLMLRKLGHRVDTVANGQEAVQAVADAGYDVVLMDIQMPIMDGLAATRIIRAECPAGKATQIIALTAGAFREDRDACLAAGMDDYLAKPVRDGNLSAALSSAAARLDHFRAGPHPPFADLAAVSPAVTTASSSMPTAAHSAVDLREFEALISSLGDAGPSIRQELITKYLDNAEEQFASLSMAADVGDCAMALKIAHMMRSSSAQMGAKTLAGLLSELEATARNGPADLTSTVHRIRFEYARVASEMGQLL